MVFFTCQYCGDPLKKPKVDKHYNTKCRFKNPSLTCVDCLKDFNGEEYIGHTQCVSEAERYSAKGTIAKEYTGKNKQEQYIQMIQSLLNTRNLTNTQRQLLEVCSSFENVPRKQKKFHNFMNNVARHIRHSVEDLNSVFHIIDESWKNETQLITKHVGDLEKSTSSESKEIMTGNKRQNEILHEELLNVNYNAKAESKKVQSQLYNENKQNSINEIKVNEVDKSKDNINRKSKKKLEKENKYNKSIIVLGNEAKSIEIDSPGEGFNDDNNSKSKIRSINCSLNKINSNTQELKREDNVDSKNVIIALSGEINHTNIKRKLDDSMYGKTKRIKTGILREGEQLSEHQSSFSWSDTIVKVLENQPNKELTLKRLSKKVINMYHSVKPDHRSFDELLVKFNKKVEKTKGITVLNNKAKIIE